MLLGTKRNENRFTRRCKLLRAYRVTGQCYENFSLCSRTATSLTFLTLRIQQKIVAMRDHLPRPPTTSYTLKAHPKLRSVECQAGVRSWHPSAVLCAHQADHTRVPIHACCSLRTHPGSMRTHHCYSVLRRRHRCMAHAVG